MTLPLPRCRHRAAFTLTELMMATGVGVTLLAASMASFVALYRSLESVGLYADLDRQDRNAIQILTRDIRQAASLTNSSPTGLWFTNADGNVLAYTYDPTNQTLSYTNGSTGQSGVLLSGCTYFNAALFQDQPTNGTMTFYPAAAPRTARGIILNFSCVRTNYASQTDSETVQEARIVMRN